MTDKHQFGDFPSKLTFLLSADYENTAELEEEQKHDSGSQIFTGLFLASVFGFVLFNLK